MFISDLKENYAEYGLPFEFADCLPDTCPICGSPLEMRETLTGLGCSNPRCPGKVAMRIKSICTKLNILGFGDSKINAFVDYYGVTNPLNMFALQPGMPLSDPDEDGYSEKLAEDIIAQIVEKRTFTLWEYVQIANIPGIQTSAQAIFSGYASLDDAYADIEEGGIEFIQERLGIKDDSVSIRAMQIYTNLQLFKDDLFESLVDVNIIDLSHKLELNIYCSDQAGGGFKHKSDFYACIEKNFGDGVHFNITSSINTKLNYLIWAGADGSPARHTSKVDKVRSYQAKGYDIPIVTADQFIAKMREIVGG